MRKALLFIVIMATFLASICTVSATVNTGNPAAPIAITDEEAAAQPMSTSCTLSFTKTSSTTARAQAMAADPAPLLLHQ